MAKRKDDAAVDIVAEITLKLPVGAGEQPGYQSELVAGGDVSLEDRERGTHFNLQIGARSAAAFIRVRNGLREAGATLTGGRPVYTNADALRYVLDALADAIE